tara:strand:- start:802 stop:1077 length:276 start_codon:yes stop_codon:yes gene_type:complete
MALNRKNALFAVMMPVLRNWAVIASLIETCNLNSVDPHAWLTATLRAIVTDHKQRSEHRLGWPGRRHGSDSEAAKEVSKPKEEQPRRDVID